MKRIIHCILIIFLLFIVLILSSETLFAQNSPGDCTQDTGSMDYCGDTPPFRGCVGGVAGNEWICMCRLKNGKWWSECSIIEDSVGKQPYINKCGGDKDKAFMQWKYDIAILETRGECSCGGQNVCGSLVPTPRPKGPEGGSQITNIPAPTIDYRPFIPVINKPRQQEQTGALKQIPFQTNSSPQIGKPQSELPEATNNINIPYIEVNLQTINTAIKRPLSYLESLFRLIILYDSKLEHYINKTILQTIW